MKKKRLNEKHNMLVFPNTRKTMRVETNANSFFSKKMDENVIQLSSLLKHYVGFCDWGFSNAAGRTKTSAIISQKVHYEIAFNRPHRFPIIAASLKYFLVKGCYEIQFPFGMEAIITSQLLFAY